MRRLGPQWPIVWVMLIFVVGIGVGVAAVLRLALTEDRAGLLVVRSKTIDFATMASVATAMVYIAWTIDPLGTR
jgi:Protein of unknown function (DUF3017)